MNIVVPFLAPSVNRCYRTSYGKFYKSREYTDYLKQMSEFLDNRTDIVKTLGKVKIEVTFYKQNNRQYDLDNRLKSLLDSIQNKLIENDNCVYEILCRKHSGCSSDKMLLIISPYVNDVLE